MDVTGSVTGREIFLGAVWFLCCLLVMWAVATKPNNDQR